MQPLSHEDSTNKESEDGKGDMERDRTGRK